MQLESGTISEKYRGHKPHWSGVIIAYPANEMRGDIIVEIGPGRGDFLFHLAEKNPDKFIYGIEIKGRRFDKLIRRRDKRKLHNVKLILADAAVAITELFEDDSVESIYINFPDPWPKKRHTKKRLLKPVFIKNCSSVLKEGGTLYITTDSEQYSTEVFKWCHLTPRLRSAYEGIRTESSEAFPTLFAEKCRADGRTIYYQKYVKEKKYNPSPTTRPPTHNPPSQIK